MPRLMGSTWACPTNSKTKEKEAMFFRRTWLLSYQVGAIGASRTRDPLLRRQMLYPTELQPHNKVIITGKYLKFKKKAKKKLTASELPS